MLHRTTRKEKLNYSFDYSKKPVLVVKDGESFVVETEDNFNGVIKSKKDIPSIRKLHPYSSFEPSQYNPLNGPIYVEGAEKGDLLEIKIEKIIPGKKGHACIFEGAGPLADSKKWPELGKGYTKIINYKSGPSGTTRDGRAIFNSKISWDIRPMIGTIGVCPDRELHSSVFAQLPMAGNWDCRDIKEGSKLYLNCYHKGALLYLGDVHASQGDLEWTRFANETKAEVTLKCKIIKNKKIPYARIEKDDSIIQLFADKPLEEAVMQSVIILMDWIISDYEMDPRDVYVMLSVNPEFRVNIYQMIKDINLKYVVGSEIPKKYLIK